MTSPFSAGMTTLTLGMTDDEWALLFSAVVVAVLVFFVPLFLWLVFPKRIRGKQRPSKAISRFYRWSFTGIGTAVVICLLLFFFRSEIGPRLNNVLGLSDQAQP